MQVLQTFEVCTLCTILGFRTDHESFPLRHLQTVDKRHTCNMLYLHFV